MKDWLVMCCIGGVIALVYLVALLLTGALGLLFGYGP